MADGDSRLAGAIERARKEAEEAGRTKGVQRQYGRKTTPGRPPLSPKGLSRTEQLWSLIIKGPFS